MFPFRKRYVAFNAKSFPTHSKQITQRISRKTGKPEKFKLSMFEFKTWIIKRFRRLI